MLKKKEAIAVLIGILFFAMLSYFTYSQITKQKKEREFVLDATIEEITEKDDKSTLLIKGLPSNNKSKQGEYEIEITDSTNIVLNNNKVTRKKLKEGQKIRIIASDIVLTKEPPIIPQITKTIIMKTTSNSDTPLTSDNKIDLKWGDGSWKAYFDKLKLSGSIGLEFNFASNLVGVPVAASVKPTFAITGSADLLDKDLLKKNPMNTFDFYAKVGAYYMKNPVKFDDEGFGIWYKWNVISADFFPIFAQFE